MSDQPSKTRKPSLVMILAGVFILFLGVLLMLTLRSVRKPKVEMLISQNLLQERGAESQEKKNTQEVVEGAQTYSLYLDVTEPKEKKILTKQTTYVRGRTAPFVEVFVNDTTLKANRTGYFSTILQLTEGENSIFVVANDTDGNFGERDMLVTYDAMIPSSPSSTLSKKPLVTKQAFVVIGTVKEKNSSGFIIQSSKHGDQRVSTDQNTRFMSQDGFLIDVKSVAVGNIVRVKGIWDRSKRTVTRVVHVKDFSIKAKPEQQPDPTITSPATTPAPIIIR
ncbi:MAG: hypothetical protein HY430_02570 [Candidatus Levybacteria bacterium]|nr:hypothetical protein [Candidatus Levybacteria bacterium]